MNNPVETDETSLSVPMIEAQNIQKWYGSFHVLKGVSLTVQRGEVVVIMGPIVTGKQRAIVTGKQIGRAHV